MLLVLLLFALAIGEPPLDVLQPGYLQHKDIVMQKDRTIDGSHTLFKQTQGGRQLLAVLHLQATGLLETCSVLTRANIICQTCPAVKAWHLPLQLASGPPLYIAQLLGAGCALA